MAGKVGGNGSPQLSVVIVQRNSNKCFCRILQVCGIYDFEVCESC